MEIEETINRQSYRGFDLVQLRQANATQTRWHVSQQESGMSSSYGFAPTETEARSKIDNLLKRKSEGKKPGSTN
jgi:hypothetical protein